MFKSLILLLLCFIKPADLKLSGAAKIQTKNVLKTGWYYIIDEKNNYLRKIDKTNEQYYIDPNPIVLIEHVTKIDMDLSNIKGMANREILVFHFDDIGTKAWSIATGKSIYKKLALVIDDKLVYAPKVFDQITNGISALNAGTYTKEELEEFEKKMKAEM
jgi:preprotein translocase subunit SecD